MIDRLREIPMFAGFGAAALAELAAVARRRDCAGGEVLFREGDAGDSVYIIESGDVEIRKQGRTLAVLGPGAVFGEMAFYDDAPRSADAVARGACVLCVIGNEDFRRMITRHSGDGVKFLLGNIREMSQRLRATSRYLVTVFETGRAVGAACADAADLARRILARLMEDMSDATGGLIVLSHPFDDTYDEVCRCKAPTLGPAEAERLIRAAEGGTIRRSDGARTLLGVPLQDKERVLGYIWIEKAAGAKFSTEEEIILAAVGHQVGLGIVNALHREEDRNRRRLEQGRMRGI